MAKIGPLTSANQRAKLLELKRCVIFNPAARGEKSKDLQKHLANLRGSKLLPTTGPGNARLLAKEAALAGYSVIVAAGGDGTLNEVANGILESEKDCQLGVVPYGTANVFARELKIPLLDFDRAWKVIEGGKTRTVDLAIAEWGLAGAKTCQAFIQVAGVGLDARTVQLVDWQMKKRFGFAAYIAAGAQAMREKKPKLMVRWENQMDYAEAVLVGNGALYGGDFRIFPGAKIDDGLLDVLLIPRMDWFSAACLAGTYFSKNSAAWRGMKTFCTSEIEVTSPNPAPFQLDGDLASTLPVRFYMCSKRLKVLAP